MRIPRTINHENMGPLLAAIEKEPYFQCGSRLPYDPSAWYWTPVKLEFPTGEAAEEGLKTIALLGRREYVTASLTGREGFVAQGLEGKIVVVKDLFSALMNLRDLLPRGRGRVVCDDKK